MANNANWLYWTNHARKKAPPRSGSPGRTDFARPSGRCAGAGPEGTGAQSHGDVLAPFRKQDADEALKLVEKSGFDNLHMSFYKHDDIGNDGVWDVWQIEGPAMLWYFRGAPHVHTWVHIREHA